MVSRVKVTTPGAKASLACAPSAALERCVVAQLARVEGDRLSIQGDLSPPTPGSCPLQRTRVGGERQKHLLVQPHHSLFQGTHFGGTQRSTLAWSRLISITEGRSIWRSDGGVQMGGAAVAVDSATPIDTIHFAVAVQAGRLAGRGCFLPTRTVPQLHCNG